MIFGRTVLRKGASKAKFDAGSDFEVRLAIAPQKPGQNSIQLIFRSKTIADLFFKRRKMKCRGSPETRFGKI